MTLLYLQKDFSFVFNIYEYIFSIHVYISFQIFIAIEILMFAKLMGYTSMYKAFGFVDSQPILIGFMIVITYIMIPLNTVSTAFCIFSVIFTP